jgi:ATP-binding cassette subfamily C protein
LVDLIMTPDSHPIPQGVNPQRIIGSFRMTLIWLALISGALNVLMLTGSFYMLEIYDRVVPSRSVPTLVGLTVLVVILYGFQGLLEFVRSRVLVRVGAAVDQAVSGRVFGALIRLPLLRSNGGDGLLPLRDLDQIRGFLAGSGLPAFFDLPWAPLYLGICFMFHPLIGITAAAGGVFLFGLTLLTEMLSRAAIREAASYASERFGSAEVARRNADAVHALGMSKTLADRWQQTNGRYIASQLLTSNIAGGLGILAKNFRMLLQSLVLGIGAYLVIQDQATAGIIIAGSILTSRALAPVDLAIANWKMFIATRQSWGRLAELMKAVPEPPKRLPLPAPRRDLVVEAASVAPPGSGRLVVRDASFSVKAGSGLGIVGPSASGKSSLVKAVVGVWTPARGNVRIDGASLDQWSPEMLGRHIGYLPQDVELLSGSVAENIARFEADVDASAVIEAAQAAGAHDLITRLPEGYETQIGQSGCALSAGQRQRIALARALYGNPFLVVLDEPNSNLDAEGEEALTQAILRVRARGGLVVVVAHRVSALAGVDSMLVMSDGRVQAHGAKDEILGNMARRTATPAVMVPDVAKASMVR